MQAVLRDKLREDTPMLHRFLACPVTSSPPRGATPPRATGALVMLSFTGYIFALQWSGALGCTLCLLHATFRPPVARALRGSALGGGGDPELQMGDGDVEGGVGRGRPAPVNANIRLRSRPAIGGVGPGMSAPPMGGGASLREGIAPMDSTSGNGLMRTHPHGN